ncbi:MAG TPA: N-6 DNA methylase [Phycisphaerae bacterium]|nr:N-6 DNA methylase [Phycisphaerae bacterium]
MFNSHWLKDQGWFALPPLRPAQFAQRVELWEALTPQGMGEGLIEAVALRIRKPDTQLVPVDDALVERLDYWRAESLRHASSVKGIDQKLQDLFAQLFVLRAVEDRRLAPRIDSLKDALQEDGSASLARVRNIFRAAKSVIQSELFDITVPRDIPASILGGIIQDLYTPSHVPAKGARYNFSWLDADILGRAYEKYLATVLIPSRVPDPQLHLFDQPLREVARVSRRKASGIYYTPSFVVRYLVDRCLDEWFASRSGRARRMPRVVDCACGSGSFLTALVDGVIARLRKQDPQRDWGREIINKKRIAGIDVDQRAVTLARLSLWLRLAQEPNPLPLPRLNGFIVCGDSLRERTWHLLPSKYDIVVGNPPFLPTARVPSRGDLQRRFRTARGRFDYSYLFVELGVSRLHAGGMLGLVVPNRVYRNRDASALRELLTREMDLLTLVDFGSTEVFSGTSSYVGLLVARRASAEARKESVRFISVREVPARFPVMRLLVADESSEHLRELNVTAYDAVHPRGAHPWMLLSRSAREARLRLEERSETLASLAGVRQGIKTGANDLFVVELESDVGARPLCVRNGLGDVHFVEGACLRPVAFGSEIGRYEALVPQRYLVYPYEGGHVIAERKLRVRYPHTYNYLASYRDLLEGRASISGERQLWYALVRERGEGWLQSRKLLMRDLAVQTSFALDESGSVFLIGGTAVVPQDDDILRALLGYLNSSLADWYLRQLTPTFRASFQKFEPQHLERLPVPTAVVTELALRDEIAALVGSVLGARAAQDERRQKEYEDRIDGLLFKAVGIDVGEIR